MRQIYLKFVFMRIRKAVSLALFALSPALTGCLVHTHSVLRTRPPEVVYSTSLDQLLNQVNQRYNEVHSMTSTVQLYACTGGAIEGQVKCVNFSGYIVIGKPENINVILKVPVVGSDALDMISDGKTFKMLIPHEDCAIAGSDVVANGSQKGLYSLRPAVILDSLLIRGLQADQVVSMTQDSWTPPQPKNRKGIIEDPDYDIEFLSEPQGQSAHTLRVVHIDRVNLLPWRQDIYNSDGKVETQASYSNYQKFGDINFPRKIEIQRPLDELSLTITISKASFNQTLPDDQFKLDIPATIAHITNMDDPASASIKDPCAAHAPQSTH
jgi:outer membrane lipoprotein-sorting protein